MTTCSKYLEGRVTQVGVLAAGRWNSEREKKEEMDQKGELHGELYILRKDLLQDRVKVQARDTRPGETRGNPEDPVQYKKKCYRGAEHRNRSQHLLSSWPARSWWEVIYLGLRKRRGQEGQCSPFSWEKTWETNSEHWSLKGQEVGTEHLSIFTDAESSGEWAILLR